MDAPKIVQQASGPAIATDAGNRIIRLNRAAMELLGYDTRRARKKNLFELTEARDTFGNRLHSSESAFFEMVSRGEPVQSFNIEVGKADGERLRVAVSVIVVLEAEGGEYELVYQLRPIYRRRKADEAIERILAMRSNPGESPIELRSKGATEQSDLTRRQIEVLRLMAQGASANEMSRTLGVSVNTVRTHIQRILRRLEVHSQLEAVAVAFRLRLI